MNASPCCDFFGSALTILVPVYASFVLKCILRTALSVLFDDSISIVDTTLNV